jgi:hypothetical protein
MNKNPIFKDVFSIVLKTNPEVDPVKRPGPGFYGSTRVNPGQPA